MAEDARKFLYEQTRDSMIDNVKAIPRELGAAVNAKLAQGASELASVLYTGSAFVQYGAEPTTPQGADHGIHGPEATPEQRMERAMEQAMEAQGKPQQADADPLDKAREAASQRVAEMGQDKGKYRSFEIG